MFLNHTPNVKNQYRQLFKRKITQEFSNYIPNTCSLDKEQFFELQFGDEVVCFPFEIFDLIMLFIPAYPYYFSYCRVSKQWQQEFQKRIFLRVSQLNLLDKLTWDEYKYWKSFYKAAGYTVYDEIHDKITETETISNLATVWTKLIKSFPNVTTITLRGYSCASMQVLAKIFEHWKLTRLNIFPFLFSKPTVEISNFILQFSTLNCKEVHWYVEEIPSIKLFDYKHPCLHYLDSFTYCQKLNRLEQVPATNFTLFNNEEYKVPKLACVFRRNLYGSRPLFCELKSAILETKFKHISVLLQEANLKYFSQYMGTLPHTVKGFDNIVCFAASIPTPNAWRIVQLLLEKGFHCNSEHQLLGTAIQFSSLTMIKFLYEKYQVQATDWDPFYYFAKRGGLDVFVLCYLIQQNVQLNKSVFTEHFEAMVRVKLQLPRLMNQLIDFSDNLKATKDFLLQTNVNGHCLLSVFMEYLSWDLILHFVQKSPDMNWKSKTFAQNRTLFHYFCKYYKDSLNGWTNLQWIINHSDVNAVDSNGNIALVYISKQKNFELFFDQWANDINFSLKNSNGQSMLELLCCKFDFVVHKSIVEQILANNISLETILVEKNGNMLIHELMNKKFELEALELLFSQSQYHTLLWKQNEATLITPIYNLLYFNGSTDIIHLCLRYFSNFHQLELFGKEVFSTCLSFCKHAYWLENIVNVKEPSTGYCTLHRCILQNHLSIFESVIQQAQFSNYVQFDEEWNTLIDLIIQQDKFNFLTKVHSIHPIPQPRLEYLIPKCITFKQFGFANKCIERGFISQKLDCNDTSILVKNQIDRGLFTSGLRDALENYYTTERDALWEHCIQKLVVDAFKACSSEFCIWIINHFRKEMQPILREMYFDNIHVIIHIAKQSNIKRELLKEIVRDLGREFVMQLRDEEGNDILKIAQKLKHQWLVQALRQELIVPKSKRQRV